jgi:hypothetical protein
VDAAVVFKQELARRLHEGILGCHQEEVVVQHLLALAQLLLRALKVVLNKQAAHKLGDRVTAQGAGGGGQRKAGEEAVVAHRAHVAEQQ